MPRGGAGPQLKPSAVTVAGSEARWRKLDTQATLLEEGEFNACEEHGAFNRPKARSPLPQGGAEELRVGGGNGGGIFRPLVLQVVCLCRTHDRGVLGTSIGFLTRDGTPRL